MIGDSVKFTVDLETASYKLMLIIWQQYWKVGQGHDVFAMLNAEYNKRDAYNSTEYKRFKPDSRQWWIAKYYKQ